MYDILLQNNSSKEIFLISGQTPAQEAQYFLEFDRLEMPSGVKSGEYSYAIIRNDRKDVEYTFGAILLETILSISVSGLTYTLDQLNPFTGLAHIDMEDFQPTAVFSNEDTENNNTVYYYEG